jgi:S1-C subfamily serine protease
MKGPERFQRSMRWPVLLLLAPLALKTQPQSHSQSSSHSGRAPSEMTAEQVFRRVASRIVFLTCDVSEPETYLASGVLVSGDGFIVTNAHVVERCRTITATYIDGSSQRSFDSTLRYYDKRTDTAVLKLQAQGLEHFDLGPWQKYQQVRAGARVYAIGNPRGFAQTISEGLVSGIRDENGVSWIQHSAPISPGSSGGALISSQGDLVGINSFLLENSQNLNFAVPAATLSTALSAARAKTGYLGFPPNNELTGEYSGIVRNLTAGMSADLKIIISASSGALRGCVTVQPPLAGSGSLRGTAHDSHFSFVVAGDSMQIEFDGQGDASSLDGSYSVSTGDKGSKQMGTFVLKRISSEGLGAGFNLQDCPNDATVSSKSAKQGDAAAQLQLWASVLRGPRGSAGLRSGGSLDSQGSRAGVRRSPISPGTAIPTWRGGSHRLHGSLFLAQRFISNRENPDLDTRSVGHLARFYRQATVASRPGQGATTSAGMDCRPPAIPQ